MSKNCRLWFLFSEAKHETFFNNYFIFFQSGGQGCWHLMSMAFSSFLSMFTVSLSRSFVCFTFKTSRWKLFLTLTILSPPQVSNLPFVRSKYIERVVCFASWKSARGTRLKSRWKCNNLMFVPHVKITKWKTNSTVQTKLERARYGYFLELHI